MSNLRNKPDQGKYICGEEFHKRINIMYFSETQKKTIRDIQMGTITSIEDYLRFHAKLEPLVGTKGAVVTPAEWGAYVKSCKEKIVLITNHTHPDYGSSVVFVVEKSQANYFESRLREFVGLIDWLESQSLIKRYSGSNNGFFVVSDNWSIKEFGDVGLCSKIIKDFGNIRIVALPPLSEFIKQGYVIDDTYQANKQFRIQRRSIWIASIALMFSAIATFFTVKEREVKVSILPNGIDTVGVYLLSHDSAKQRVATDTANTKAK